MPPTTQQMDMLPLFQSVQQYYETSFNHLVWVMGTIVTVVGLVVGVIMPIAIQFYQRKALQLDKEELRREISSEITSLENKLNSMVATVVTNVSEDLRKDMDGAMGAVLHVQGNVLKDQGMAVNSYITATTYYLNAGQIENAKSLMISIASLLGTLTVNEGIEIVPKVSQLVGEISSIKDAPIKAVLAPALERMSKALVTAKKS